MQAAALAGNIQQESGFNPAAVNAAEEAFGLLQWRLDRRKALESLAAARGVPASDLGTQLDFIIQEMRGPEARNAAAFLAAADLPAANEALRRFIRYGDRSEDARLRYAQAFLQGDAAPQAATPSPAFGRLAVDTADNRAAAVATDAPDATATAQPNWAALASAYGWPKAEDMPQLAVPPLPAPVRRRIDLSRLHAALLARRASGFD